MRGSMMSRITASYPPNRAASRPLGPSAAVSTTKPSAARPFARAAAIRASSSTTSNRTASLWHATLSVVSGRPGHDDAMSLFTDHPRARWAAPGAALAVIGAVALAANHTASADPSLPPRSAAQLL